ncbi:alpha-L-rhamnosidase-related protein [Arthrobacter sp. SA17]
MTAVAAHGFHGIPIEDVDARAFSHAWLTSAPDDGWSPAAIARATHLGALAKSQPPTDPYGPMFPRPIGQLDGTIIQPVSQSVTHNLPFQSDSNHPALRNAEFSKLHPGQTRRPFQPDSEFEVLPGSARLVTLDFGRIVCGYVSFDLAAPTGTRVDLLYQERDADPAAAQRISSVTGARYTARGSHDRFEALEVNGLRYIRALITAESPATVSLRRVAVREYLYPTQGEAFFHSSDTELNSLYHAGRRTVTLNSHDAYTDCPTREQRAWVGDGVVHQMVDLTTSTDWSLAWWYLELAHSPRYDGMLPRSVVGDMEYAESTAIPDWALNWIHGVHNFYRYDGSKDKLREYLPTVERILRWFLPCRNTDGVLEHVPEWNLVDWSAIFLTGTSSIITAMWARGLREFAEMSDYVGNMGNAMWATDLWAQARSGFEVFWDPERATYVDHVIDGMRQAPASQLAGATAIVSGMAPHERFGSVVDWIGDPTKLVVQSWIGSNGSYDDVRIAEHLRGVQHITWDPQEQVVRAEPFGSYIVHDAFATAGRTDTIIREIRRWTQFLVDGFDTFGECWGWGTPAHGWSATPTRDIVQRLLGVEPAEPGFSTASINPAYGLVENFSGAVPTPHGLIHLTVRGGTTKINSPVPFTLTNQDGSVTSHPAGTMESW